MTNAQNIIVLGLALLVIGCMQGTPYRTYRDTPPDVNGVITEKEVTTLSLPKIASSRECTGGRCVNFVEFDEFGNVEGRRQFNNALIDAKAVAKSGGVVLVFIHGWHHNSSPGDSDIENFKKMVARVEDGRPAAGIYVGWRGESIDSNVLLGVVPSYLGTFWDRKNTAHSIGNAGGVTELVRTLSDIRSSFKDSRLLIIGHSFGGAILYSAMSDGIAEQIRRDCQGSDQFTPIADLVVLVNPAFEAMRLRPLYSYARNFEFPSNQKPRLIMITSDADWATESAFKVGRHLETIFQSYPSGPHKEEDVTAIGHYQRYITHQLQVDPSCSVPKGEIPLAATARPVSMCITDKLRLTRCDGPKDCNDVARGHFIIRGEAGSHIPHNFPIYNIRTTGAVIPSHVRIWEPAMESLLLSLPEVVDHSEEMPIAPATPTGCGTPKDFNDPLTEL